MSMFPKGGNDQPELTVGLTNIPDIYLKIYMKKNLLTVHREPRGVQMRRGLFQYCEQAFSGVARSSTRHDLFCTKDL